jgi:hypothetical protein
LRTGSIAFDVPLEKKRHVTGRALQKRDDRICSAYDDKGCHTSDVPLEEEEEEENEK